jgi:zinc protease
VALCACGGAPPESNAIKIAVDLKTEPYRLANGLEVVIHEEPSFREVAVNMRYRVGSKDDPMGQSGIAHFAEHLMFRGSRHIEGRTFQEALDEVTVAKANAYTSHDETEYSTILPAKDLPRALWLEADRMAYPASGVTETAFAVERDVVKK